jgi:hypothetical protein
MKTKTRKMLPKRARALRNGGIYRQHVRCGKQNCRCARALLHTAYYFFTRKNGKLVKFYIRRTELAGFTALVNQAKEERKARRRMKKSNQQSLKQARRELHERQLLINSLKGI